MLGRWNDTGEIAMNENENELKVTEGDFLIETPEGPIEVDFVDIEECTERVPHAHRYGIRIDDDKYELRERKPKMETILALRGVGPCSHELLRLFRHKDAVPIEPGQIVDLGEPGSERFATVHREIVTIYVQGNAAEIKRGPTPLAEIKKLGGLPDGYQLALDDDGTLIPLAADKPFDIQGCEVFEGRPPAGGAS
jgi:hypothetical protein